MQREPNLGPGAVGALEVPDEHIVCPFTPPLAFATQAVLAGVDLRRSEPVVGLERVDGRGWVLETPRGAVTADWVVNAAGLRSDEVHRMAGHDGFTVTPRRGELIVFDKLSRPLVNHVLLPVPTETTKGVLVAPTVFGNVMLGPTAVDIERKDDTSSTADGLAHLQSLGHRLIPDLAGQEVTAVYVGLRAATEHSDYQLGVDAGQRYAWAGGIRSTGLTGSMAIAEHVRDELDRAGLALRESERGPPRAADAEHRRGGAASLRPAGAHRRGPRLRAGRLLLRAGHAGRDSRRGREPGPAHRPRRAAPPDPRVDGALPGLLLRRARRRAIGRAQ